MKGAFSSRRSGFDSGFWIALILSILYLAMFCRGAESCPADAVAPGVQISVAAYRHDGKTPIGTGFVSAGERVILRTAIFYVPVDPISGSTLSAVQQGKLTITLNGSTADVTPNAGIPIVGPCQGVTVVSSTNASWVVTEADAAAGQILIRADYSDGIALLFAPVRVRATAHTRVRVRPTDITVSTTGPLAIEKLETGNTRLTFSGPARATYRIDATSDFAQWLPIGTTTADAAGLCRIDDLEAHSFAHRFYRYVVEN